MPESLRHRRTREFKYDTPFDTRLGRKKRNKLIIHLLQRLGRLDGNSALPSFCFALGFGQGLSTLVNIHHIIILHQLGRWFQ
ncbi:hypothetical protein BYT27DRAFT_7186664 [Phlegmacium glaucopus]|nr:hypothetical protein BYT27DRAFT_7186664 [Phlegmacium glaucopus]